MVDFTPIRQDYLTDVEKSWDYQIPVNVKNVGKGIMWICRTLLQAQITTKHDKTYRFIYTI